MNSKSDNQNSNPFNSNLNTCNVTPFNNSDLPIELYVISPNDEETTFYFEDRSACAQFVCDNLQLWLDAAEAVKATLPPKNKNGLWIAGHDNGYAGTPAKDEWLCFEDSCLYLSSKRWINRLDLSCFPSQDNLISYKEDIFTEDSSEFAMQAGMAFGCDGYNDAIGSSYEPYDPSIHDPGYWDY